MTNSKALHEGAEEDLVVKLSDMEGKLLNAEMSLSSVVESVKTHAGEEASGGLNRARQDIGQCMNILGAAKQNLEFVTEVLNMRKASFELKEIALKSWPKKSYIERMTWIATALFPAGGIPFVFAGGVTDSSLLVAVLAWSVASVMLILSLRAMKEDDDDKWEFYENEFGIYRNMREQMAKLWNIDLKEKANWVEPEIISRINYPTPRRRDQSKEK